MLRWGWKLGFIAVGTISSVGAASVVVARQLLTRPDSEALSTDKAADGHLADAILADVLAHRGYAAREAPEAGVFRDEIQAVEPVAAWLNEGVSFEPRPSRTASVQSRELVERSPEFVRNPRPFRVRVAARESRTPVALNTPETAPLGRFDLASGVYAGASISISESFAEQTHWNPDGPAVAYAAIVAPGETIALDPTSSSLRERERLREELRREELVRIIRDPPKPVGDDVLPLEELQTPVRLEGDWFEARGAAQEVFALSLDKPPAEELESVFELVSFSPARFPELIEKVEKSDEQPDLAPLDLALEVTTTPEPATLWLLASGLIALSIADIMRRRNFKG